MRVTQALKNFHIVRGGGYIFIWIGFKFRQRAFRQKAYYVYT
jgi:hypothetical protein